MNRALIDNLWDLEYTGRDKHDVRRVGRLLSTRVCPTGSCVFFPFLFYFNYTGFIVTCSAATPSHNAIRASRGPLSPRPRARNHRVVS